MTYFGGDKKNGLAPDDECKELWLSLGYLIILKLNLRQKDPFINNFIYNFKYNI